MNMNGWRFPKRRQLLSYLIVLALLHSLGCAAQKAYRNAQEAARKGEWDRAVGQYMIALNKKPENPQYRTGFERARLAASQFHFQKAKQLVETHNYEQAIIEFQIALNFDPTNQYITNELAAGKKLYERELNRKELTEIEKAKEESKRKMQLYKVLGPEAETIIPSLRFRDDSLKHILDALGQLAGINVVYDSDFRDQEFSVSLDNIKFRDALQQILVANRLYYKPLDQSTILVIPDNPQKRRQYDEQVIQTFYLSNAELNDVLNMVRSVMQIQRIATNPQLNAITIRDTPDKVAIVQKIIEANDKSRSEVLLDVEILEVDRDQTKSYGINLDTYSISQSLVINETPGQIFGNQIPAIDAAAWSFTVPSILYTALATDQRTKILAKPQIRASEGQQVTVRLGDRVPIPVTNIQVPGTTPSPIPNVISTTSFQLTDVGINIDVTPRVHHNREITLTMRFELTSITAPGVGTLPPTLGNRTVNTVIRLKDGETNLLAGLLRRDERKSLRGVPGIINVPFVRDLFAQNDKTLQEKDVIFTITPHILRTPNVTEEDLSPIWIGTEDDIRLKSAPPISVFERSDVNKQEQPWEQGSQEIEQGNVTPDTATQEKPVGEPNPEGMTQHPTQHPTPAPTHTQPKPPAPQPQQAPAEVVPEETTPLPQTAPHEEEIPPQAEQPQTQPGAVVPPVTPQVERGEGDAIEAVISFTSLNVNPKVGTDVVLNVQVEGAETATSISTFLGFDPSAVQIKNILQGPYVTPGAFTKSFDNARGIVQINASRTAGNQPSGVAATIVLTGLKPGKATINLNSAVIRDAAANVIQVTFLPFTIEFQP
jgi:general secretion pathway protein D